MRWLLVTVCLACGSEWAPVGPMLLEARNNNLAAAQEYQGKDARLTGIVVRTGKKKIEHGAQRTDARWQESPSAEADVEYPFVEIRDAEHPSPDVVTCYLSRPDAAAPSVAAGATVRVHGFLLEFAASGGRIDGELTRCTLE